MHKQQEHTKHLTPEQMELYLSDKLEGQAAFEVERHLLDCEFCAEAMEGLEETHHFHGFTDDIDILKTRIENRVAQEDLKLAINWRAVGVAATVVILIGVGSLFFWLREPKPTKPIVAAKKVETKKEEVKPVPMPEDTLTEINISPAQRTLVADAKPKPQIIEDVEEVEEPKVEFDMVSDEGIEVTEVADAVESETTLTLSNKDLAISQPMFNSTSNTFFGTSPANNINLIEDTLNIFKATDEVIAEVVSTKQLQEVEVKKIQAIPQSDVETLSAVSISKDKSVSKAKEEVAEPLTPQPLTGFIKYDEYLKTNLKYPAEAKKNNISGKVVVSFKLNEYGKPTKIKVEQGLGYGCDEEAIRLIENGPLWNMESKDRVEYRVVFTL